MFSVLLIFSNEYRAKHWSDIAVDVIVEVITYFAILCFPVLSSTELIPPATFLSPPRNSVEGK